MPGHPGGEAKTSPRRLTAFERSRQAYELRKFGATFESIAQALGYESRQAAHKSVISYIKRLCQEDKEQGRVVDIERVDVVLLAMMVKARGGDVRAAQVVLSCLERRARMMGYDQPLKVDMALVRKEAERIAAETGMTVDEVLAEADRIVMEARGT